ncbi:3-oxoacyl-[acyl-carrier protein] reductase [Parapusillimonas granuli]|nr:3-oxoacyl-[acyl-carrier protein] reductase [Parapusillimonas granuli]
MFSYLACNVSDIASTQAAFEQIQNQTEKIDALICSAGVLRAGRLVDQPPEHIDMMMNVNIKGPWLSTRYSVPLLKNGSTPGHPARVVFVGSISGIRPKVGTGFYAASKAALHVLVGVLAVELADANILVNAVAPGTVATPMICEQPGPEGIGTSFRPSGMSPLGRIAEPDDVVDVILFFLGERSCYVTGTVLPVDGGTRAAFSPK